MTTNAMQSGVRVERVEATKVTISGSPYTIRQLRDVVKAFEDMDNDTELEIIRTSTTNTIGELTFIAPPHPALR